MFSEWFTQISLPSSESRLGLDLVQQLMRTASHDNVQVLAIFACWEVGGRLPVAPKTRTKVIRSMTSTLDPVTIDWLGASVGFFSEDCAVKLSTDEAGARFLSLACALVTTIGPYEGAKVLDIELKRTGLSYTQDPLLSSVRDLLAALLPRSERCNFTNLILGYELLVGDALNCQIIQPPAGQSSARLSAREQTLRKLLPGAPFPEAIAGLIGVLREVGEPDDPAVLGITLTIGGSVPWILAFVEWCLGAPASVYIEGRDEPVLENEDSDRSVKAIILNGHDETKNSLEAVIHRPTGDTTQLLGPIDQTPLPFMIKVEGYAEWLFHELGFRRHGDPEFNKNMTKIIAEAIRLAIPLILSLNCGSYGRLGREENPSCRIRFQNNPSGFGISPLPDMQTIQIACNNFLKSIRPEAAIEFQALPSEHMIISDMPLVSPYIDSLRNTCVCGDCCGTSFEQYVSKERCLEMLFFRSLAFLILDIPAFSLLDCPSLTRLLASRQRRGGDDILGRISAILQRGRKLDSPEIDPMDIFSWTKSLVGHGDIDDKHDDLIIKSHGYLRLRVLPGTLRRDGEAYDVVSCAKHGMPGLKRHDHPDLFSSLEVAGIESLVLSFQVSWTVELLDNRKIQLYLMLLRSLSDAILLDKCVHPQDEELPQPDPYLRYIAPWNDHTSVYDSHSKICVVAVADSQMIRAFAHCCITGQRVSLYCTRDF
ncbi:hypothetical protein FALBO_4612 [Fusarium albosuccineum]|uniref:Uncharacterized protein n=1 Tax=Fusarium albosuccineum TaxID=1237068 RepID=A0A8H4PDH5_9HYPO|nr:hypothetical protein FALBO_4612 [Fusarium albosuccineum]